MGTVAHRPAAEMPGWAYEFTRGAIEFRTTLLAKIDRLERKLDKVEDLDKRVSALEAWRASIERRFAR